MDETIKIQILKHLRHLQVTVDIIMIEFGNKSKSNILRNLLVLYNEIDNLAKKVDSDGME